MKFLWIVASLFAMLAAVVLFDAFIDLKQSAPQQAAEVAMAIGVAVIPYCFARCVQQSLRKDDEVAAKQTKLLAQIANSMAEKDKSEETPTE